MTREEINKVIEQAPKDEKGRAIIPHDIFLENYRDLPEGVKSEEGFISTGKGSFLKCVRRGSADRDICSKGGKATAKVWGEKKTFAEELQIFLSSTDPVTGKTIRQEVVEGLVAKAIDGSVGAFEAIRDTVGEKPVDELDMNLITQADRDLMKRIFDRVSKRD